VPISIANFSRLKLREGTYVIKYTCKNAKGAAATPIYRTVIVDFKKEEEYWEAQAEMQVMLGFLYTLVTL
jgi:hypothetical protein